MRFKFKKGRTEPVPTEQQMDIAQCLQDIHMAVVAAATFLDENASEKTPGSRSCIAYGGHRSVWDRLELILISSHFGE